jgi:hypothetical protein
MGLAWVAAIDREAPLTVSVAGVVVAVFKEFVNTA